MNLRERAAELFDELDFVDLKPHEVPSKIDIIERHLREACEEAVRTVVQPHPDDVKEAMAKLNIPLEPTAADALKAVQRLAKAMCCMTIECGCADLLSGYRDTPAARAITGEEAENNSTTPPPASAR